jgi:hypothetical protein
MWILPKKLILTCAQDMEVLDWDSSESFQTLEQSLMSKSKNTLARSWQAAWKRGRLTLHRYGVMLKPSRESHRTFAERWTSLLPVIPVSHSAAPGEEKAYTTPGTYGPTLDVPTGLFDLQSYSLRTSRDTLRLDSPQCLQIWQQMVIRRRGDYLARKKSAHLTREKESLSWPTANTMDSLPVRPVEEYAEENRTRGGRENGKALSNLREAVHSPVYVNWQTPRGFCKQGQDVDRNGNVTPTLASQVMSGPPDQDSSNTTGNLQGSLFPTPNVAMAKQGTQRNKDPKAGYQLEAVANNTWATPRAKDGSHGAQTNNIEGKSLIRASGQRFGIDLPSQAEKAQGKLNPRWVETLMGLPIGWVNPEIETLNSAAHYANVYHRESELRMLGNGVVPATAAKAYRVLSGELNDRF